MPEGKKYAKLEGGAVGESTERRGGRGGRLEGR